LSKRCEKKNAKKENSKKKNSPPSLDTVNSDNASRTEDASGAMIHSDDASNSGASPVSSDTASSVSSYVTNISDDSDVSQTCFLFKRRKLREHKDGLQRCPACEVKVFRVDRADNIVGLNMLEAFDKKGPKNGVGEKNKSGAYLAVYV
jgi:hypothetical protein